MLRPLTALCLIAAAVAASPASADPVEDFYAGKRLSLTVGYGPGGGFDVFARLVARHMGKYIPGHPDIVVQNMQGAGGLRAVNFLYAVAPKDGTALGLIARNMPMLGLVSQNSGIRFDPRKFGWIGSSSDFSTDAYVMIMRKDAPLRSVADMRRPDGPSVVIGGTAEGASSADVPRILHDTLGLNFKLVLGYPNSAGIFLALESGEVAGRMVEYSSLRSARPQWLAPDSPFRVILQYARVARHPDFPDVPTARELATTDTARALIEFTETPLLTMAWPFAAPPGIPEDRLRALREAFAATHRDPQFLAEAANARIEITPVTADKMIESIDRMSHAPPDVFDYVRKMMVTGKGG